MEIIVGSLPPLERNVIREQPAPSGQVEAKLLHVRPPRRGIAGPSGMERRGKKTSDPQSGRVLTVLVPDSAVLPKDLDKANYKVFLRFQKK